MAGRFDGCRTAILVFRFSLPGFFHQLPLNRLFLPVEDSGGFFIVFPLFVLPDDAFLFYHALKTLNSLFQHLVVVNDNMGQVNHLPSVYRSELVAKPLGPAIVSYILPIMRSLSRTGWVIKISGSVLCP